MTPFLPALDVYHRCVDENTTIDCGACHWKFRLGASPAKGESARCVSLGRKPQRLGWHQEWCNFTHVDLQEYTNVTCDCEFSGQKAVL
ncbi:hypothetical protein AAVH_07218 [Aphelenchoides avenae]|nr:hypothetical protein AAVH_07218 [Aphelenchus avenae]